MAIGGLSVRPHFDLSKELAVDNFLPVFFFNEINAQSGEPCESILFIGFFPAPCTFSVPSCENLPEPPYKQRKQGPAPNVARLWRCSVVGGF